MVNHHHNAAASQPLLIDMEQNSSDIEADERADGADSGHPDAPLEVVDDISRDAPAARFIQDERAAKRWQNIPQPLRRVFLVVAKWSRGPVNPQPFRIKPLFPVVQEYPLRLVDRLLPKAKHRAWLLFLYFSVWLITFVLIKWQETVAADVVGWGQAREVRCGDTYWSAGNGCGLDGNDCRPFSNGAGFAFQCPANCESYHVLNPRAVGDQEVIYRPLVIGGPPSRAHPELATYRGDSYLCGAAIHAGLFKNKKGGCGVVQLVGRQQNFISSRRNGILSVGFDSYFPLSFRFVPDVECAARDARWSLLALSAVFTGVLALFTASPALFFFPTFTGIFWTVGMALDQPNHSSVAGLFSNVLGKFLPAMFCAWVMYDKMGIRRALDRLTAQVEKSVLWLGGCWVGAMTNYTLDKIPIQRLTPHDLNQQPGAKTALAIIIFILITIAMSQVWFFRKEGRFIKYIQLYGLFILSIIIGLVLPGLNLRIHHYTMALLLIPGTSLQTRPSLLYQGFLVGLFINGIARWGFDPVLQTSAALQGDAQKGSVLPIIATPIIDVGNGSNGVSSITFTWHQPPGLRFDGVSILVNDVERFRSYFEDLPEDTFVWTRNSSLGMAEYFRFAFVDGSTSGDYTKAGTWTAEGGWTGMKSGPSKVKVRDIEGERRLP